MKHPITPLILVHADGYTEYRCLDCGRPTYYGLSGVDRARRWKHYQHANWKPGSRKAA